MNQIVKDKKYLVLGDKSWIQNNKGKVLIKLDKQQRLYYLNQKGDKHIPKNIFKSVNNNIADNQIYQNGNKVKTVDKHQKPFYLHPNGNKDIPLNILNSVNNYITRYKDNLIYRVTDNTLETDTSLQLLTQLEQEILEDDNGLQHGAVTQQRNRPKFKNMANTLSLDAFTNAQFVLQKSAKAS